jgi:hypothetical protein
MPTYHYMRLSVLWGLQLLVNAALSYTCPHTNLLLYTRPHTSLRPQSLVAEGLIHHTPTHYCTRVRMLTQAPPAGYDCSAQRLASRQRIARLVPYASAYPPATVYVSAY